MHTPRLRFLGFTSSEKDQVRRATISKQHVNETRCLEGNPGLTAFAIDDHGSLLLCDVSDCPCCSEFADRRQAAEKHQSDLAMATYEDTVGAARARIPISSDVRRLPLEDPMIHHVLLPCTQTPVFLGFLLYFCVHGVRMTSPVEDWIRRAGQRCEDLGYLDLGRMLCKHAKHEANHHLMLIEDLRILVRQWNTINPQQPLDADALLESPPLRSVAPYIDLHEEVIASETPFGQLAIEYEIERMSTVLGPRILAASKRALGDLEGLSFIREHTELDVGHTAMNRRALRSFLGHYPEEAETMGKIGASAIHAYLNFLSECFVTSIRAFGLLP